MLSDSDARADRGDRFVCLLPPCRARQWRTGAGMKYTTVSGGRDAYRKGTIRVENYILRIYRRDEHHPDRVVGVVEDVENGETTPFRNLGQLIAILSKQHSLDVESEELERV